MLSRGGAAPAAADAALRRITAAGRVAAAVEDGVAAMVGGAVAVSGAAVVDGAVATASRVVVCATTGWDACTANGSQVPPMHRCVKRRRASDAGPRGRLRVLGGVSVRERAQKRAIPVAAVGCGATAVTGTGRPTRGAVGPVQEDGTLLSTVWERRGSRLLVGVPLPVLLRRHGPAVLRVAGGHGDEPVGGTVVVAVHGRGPRTGGKRVVDGGREGVVGAGFKGQEVGRRHMG